MKTSKMITKRWQALGLNAVELATILREHQQGCEKMTPARLYRIAEGLTSPTELERIAIAKELELDAMEVIV